MKLEDLESFIKQNNHLPNIPTNEEVNCEGVDLLEINSKLLAKVEELTLYIIGLQKQINNLKINEK
nr:hypothetical protein [Bacteroidota bacterium]